MALPAIIAAHDDADVIERVESQLFERYSRHYRIEVVRNPGEAVQLLARLAGEDADVALVLAGPVALEVGGRRAVRPGAAGCTRRRSAPCSSPRTPGPTRRRPRRSAGRWRSAGSTTSSSSRAHRRTRSSTRPSPSFLLEWAREQRRCRTPCTSSARSGRAERTSCGRCSRAAPSRTSSALPIPSEGRELLARGRPGRPAAADGTAGRHARSATHRTPRSRSRPPARRRAVDERDLRPPGRRRRAGGPVRGRLRRLGGLERRRRGRRRASAGRRGRAR